MQLKIISDLPAIAAISVLDVTSAAVTCTFCGIGMFSFPVLFTNKICSSGFLPGIHCIVASPNGPVPNIDFIYFFKRRMNN